MGLISPLAIAPMIDWTYMHFRVLMRLLAPHALLYTEMQTSGAIEHNPQRALEFHRIETPVALQMGGSDPKILAECARKAETAGYIEVNLNLGCPSPRVLAGQFGACLMNDAPRVAACIREIKRAVQIPVTAKIRLGIDHQDSYAFFADFAHMLVDAGCDKLIVHARKAWLTGLNPKQNRTIPPINYDYVYQIKQQLPAIPVVINGQIQTIAGLKVHLQHVDGIMVGRLACQNPYAIAQMHHVLYPEDPLPDRIDVLKKYLAISAGIQGQSQQKIPLSRILKPLFNIMHGLPGASAWKSSLMKIKGTNELEIWRQLEESISALDTMQYAETY